REDRGRPDHARRAPRPRQRPGRDRGRTAVGGRCGLAAGGRAGDQGSRPRARLRGGGAMTVGLYGAYGGRYVPETLIPALDELALGWEDARGDDAFHRELHELLTTFGGRPPPATPPGGFGPPRRAQAEQHARAGAARPASREAADRRRDGSRPARRRHRDGLRTLRLRLR